MEQKQQAPDAQGQRAGAYTRIFHKGKEYFLSSHSYRVFSHLFRTGQCSTLDISYALNISDPRSTIRHLRNIGIDVADVWCRTANGNRYKRYFIREEAGDE